jgi:phosphoglycolate phosphatase
MDYRAVLFDLDGTLLNTLRDIADSANRALEALGLPPHETAAYQLFVGEGEDSLTRKALPPEHRTEREINETLARIREEYAQRWANNTRPYPGVPEMLDSLTGSGIRMAILSNKSDSFARLTVSRLLEKWHFECVVGVSPSVLKKPDPTAARQIASTMGLKPGEFIYLGDSAVDMKTATAAAMFPVGALWGFRTAAELLAGGAKMLLQKPSQLVGLIGRRES